MLLDICSKIMKISLTVQRFRTNTIFILHIPNESNSEKRVELVVLVLCILSDEVYICYKFHENIVGRFKIIEWSRF